MRILDRLRNQDGVAMVVVMGSLLVISLSAGVVAATASQTNSSSIDDTNSKEALAAAEAGLQVGTQRFQQHRASITSTECLAGTAAGSVGIQKVTVTAGSECPAVPDVGELDPGASYSYVISLPGAGCRSTATPTTNVTPNDRCITSTGTVNGVTRRVQTRLGWSPGDPYFASAGIVGLDGVEFNNSIPVTATSGTNGTISLNNSVTVTGNASVYPGTPPSSQIDIGASSSFNGTASARSTPWSLDIGEQFEEAEAANDNLLIPATRFSDGSGRRHFRIPSGDYQLPARAGGGTTVYYFCSVLLDSGVNLTLVSGREYKIYLDSPTRTGTGCSSGGTIHFNNSIRVNVPGGWSDPCTSPTKCGYASNLEFYLAGTGGSTDFHAVNSVDISALIFAPNSDVHLNNSVRLNGAVAAKTVHLNNSVTFTFPADAASNVGPNRRTTWSGWFECSPQPAVATDPESGC